MSADSPSANGSAGHDRRRFLRRLGAGTAAAVGAGALGAAAGCSDDGDVAAGSSPDPALGRAGGGGGHGGRVFPFEGAHQAGVVTPSAPASLLASFDVVATDRGRLAETLRLVTTEIRRLMAADPAQQRSPGLPAADTGILGVDPEPASLALTLAVGASLFDERFGLADRRPRELDTMPFLANDRLDPAQSHGDLLLTISADRPEVVQHALRQVMRQARGSLTLHWVIDGYSRSDAAAVPGRTPVRNLMGFKDGTANLDISKPQVMDSYVWVGADSGEPAWATGGSYQVVRIIRMFVEQWDRTPLSEQEKIFGRRKASGAPLGGSDETDPVVFENDADGHVIPLDAHIRLANPRTAATAGSLILRRGFSFSRGFDGAGMLDQGLAFVSFQASLEKGFLAVQERLKGEPLEEYTLVVGGGFFYALPGVIGPQRWLGDTLLEG